MAKATSGQVLPNCPMLHSTSDALTLFSLHHSIVALSSPLITGLSTENHCVGLVLQKILPLHCGAGCAAPLIRSEAQPTIGASFPNGLQLASNPDFHLALATPPEFHNVLHIWPSSTWSIGLPSNIQPCPRLNQQRMAPKAQMDRCQGCSPRIKPIAVPMGQ